MQVEIQNYSYSGSRQSGVIENEQIELFALLLILRTTAQVLQPWQRVILAAELHSKFPDAFLQVPARLVTPD